MGLGPFYVTKRVSGFGGEFLYETVKYGFATTELAKKWASRNYTKSLREVVIRIECDDNTKTYLETTMGGKPCKWVTCFRTVNGENRA